MAPAEQAEQTKSATHQISLTQHSSSLSVPNFALECGENIFRKYKSKNFEMDSSSNTTIVSTGNVTVDKVRVKIELLTFVQVLNSTQHSLCFSSALEQLT